MDSRVKIMCSLFIIVMIQATDSFPQLSVPFVSWNENKEEPSRYPLNVRVQNPFSSIFGKNSNSRQYPKRENKKVVDNYEKIITVTPNAIYFVNDYEEPRKFVEPTQDPRIWGTYVSQNQGFYDPNNDKKSENKLVKNNNFVEDDVKTDTDLKETTEYTTESATEYESTFQNSLNSIQNGNGEPLILTDCTEQVLDRNSIGQYLGLIFNLRSFG